MLTMPGEVVLARLADVTLTTYRVQQEVDRWGEKKLTTITLDDLTSCNIESRSKPIWLVLGVLVAFPALLLFPPAALVGVFICSGWFFSRRKIMVLRSASEKIEVQRSSYGNWQELQQFIHQIQMVKADRTAASRAGSLVAVLGGQQEVKRPLESGPTVTPLRHPEQPVAEKPAPLPKPEQGAVLPARDIWMAPPSFTFDSRALSSSAGAPAVARKSAEVGPETSSPQPAAPDTQRGQRSEGAKSISAKSEGSESAEKSSETAPPGTAPLPPASAEPPEQGASSSDIAPAAAKLPKAHSTAALIASISITAIIVLAAAFLAMNWLSTSPRSAQQIADQTAKDVAKAGGDRSQKRELNARDILDLAAPGIVSIEAFDEAGLKKGSGVGFVADGTTIVTNYRVIRGSNAVKVRFQNGDIADVLGVLGHDVGLNVAVLRISGGSTSSAPLGDSGPLQIGSRVFAVCGRDSQNPLSSGQVSGIRGDGLIQTSIPLGPSSGCPLLNAHGEVVGIAVTGVPGSPNRNFVVPISWAKNYMANTEVSSLQDLIARNTVVQTLIRSALSVPARQRQSWSFVVDGDRMANPELVGSFSSAGGLGGQVRFLVVTGENQELYDSGRTTGEAVRVSLPPGKCMLVFDNSESLVFARNVTADFSLHYVR